MQSENHDKLSLDYLFHPNSIAVAGVSPDMTKLSQGRHFLESLIDAGFKGKLYPVGREAGEVFGLQIYPSVRDIPDTVDYVISAIPARHTPQLIAECASIGVKAVQIFSAGFSEIADEGGRQLQSQIATMAQETGMRVIGPNCMGLYCPESGLAFHPDFSKESGTISFMSQSGGFSIHTIREAAMRGIYFSKVISYGNACDLNESDFLEYLTHDPETRIIAVYIEGTKDGSRFARILRQASKTKPVIIYKGGATESGTRAVVSHTGAIAGSNRIWDSLLRQVGAIQVHSMEEMLDILSLFRCMPPPKGRATALIGVGGGNSVQAADACSNAGLAVPLLPPKIRRKLEDLYASEVGSSFRNPVDTYFARWDLAQETLRIIADCDQIDLLIIHITIGFNPRYEAKLSIVKQHVEAIIDLSKEINKPVATVLQPIGLTKFGQVTSEAQAALHKAGFPVYFSVGQAARAIAKYIEYYHH